MIRISVKVDDSIFKAFQQNLPGIKEAANRAAGFVIMDDIAERFEGEGNPPEKWTPLSPITIKRRAKRANGGAIRILNDTGALKSSFMVGDADNAFEADQSKVTVGTKKVYAAPHQWGWAKKNIPARPMIIDPKDSADLKEKLKIAYSAILKAALT